jgi:hypothetical protein
MTKMPVHLAACIAIVAATPVRSQVWNAWPGFHQGIATPVFTVHSESFRNERVYKSTGIVLGASPAFVYVATAAHSTADALQTHVRLLNEQGEEFTIQAEEIGSDSTLDVAILRVARPTQWQTPPALPHRGFGDRVFMFGCPREECFFAPIPGTWIANVGSLIEFNATDFAPGVSGGALVDRDGALVGMVTKYSGTTGYAVSIDRVREAARSAGATIDLPHPRVIRHQAAYFNASLHGTPSPGNDADGTGLARGGRFEYGLDVAPFIDFTYSLTHLVWTSKSEVWRTRDTYVATYMGIGYRLRVRSPISPLASHGHYDYITLGFDVLDPTARYAIVTNLPTDSVNTKYGEQQLQRSVVRASAHVSTAIHVEYRRPLTDRWAVGVAGSVYSLSWDRPENVYSFPSVLSTLEVGLSYRFAMN